MVASRFNLRFIISDSCFIHACVSWGKKAQNLKAENYVSFCGRKPGRQVFRQL